MAGAHAGGGRGWKDPRGRGARGRQGGGGDPPGRDAGGRPRLHRPRVPPPPTRPAPATCAPPRPRPSPGKAEARLCLGKGEFPLRRAVCVRGQSSAALGIADPRTFARAFPGCARRHPSGRQDDQPCGHAEQGNRLSEPRSPETGKTKTLSKLSVCPWLPRAGRAADLRARGAVGWGGAGRSGLCRRGCAPAPRARPLLARREARFTGRSRPSPGPGGTRALRSARSGGLSTRSAQPAPAVDPAEVSELRVVGSFPSQLLVWCLTKSSTWELVPPPRGWHLQRLG